MYIKNPQTTYNNGRNIRMNCERVWTEISPFHNYGLPTHHNTPIGIWRHESMKPYKYIYVSFSLV